MSLVPVTWSGSAPEPQELTVKVDAGQDGVGGCLRAAQIRGS